MDAKMNLSNNPKRNLLKKMELNNLKNNHLSNQLKRTLRLFLKNLLFMRINQ